MNHITGMDMLEALTDKLTDQPGTASYTQAISRHLLAYLKDFTLDWVTANWISEGLFSRANLQYQHGKQLNQLKRTNTMNMCLQKEH